MIDKEELLKELIEILNKPKEVYIEVCDEDVVLPEYSHPGDAGMDIRANKDTELLPGETKIIPTGIKVAIPSGYEIQVRPRSGLSFKTPLRVANSPGTIDSGYKDEIGIIITNTSVSGNDTYSIDEKGNKQGIYKINKGDRIAQIVLSKYETIEFIKTEDVTQIGTNRNGGFGSTGIK